jgi:hypothetical protein
MSAAHSHAAGNAKCFAGDKGSVVGSQEQYSCGDFVGLAEPP